MLTQYIFQKTFVSIVNYTYENMLKSFYFLVLFHKAGLKANNSYFNYLYVKVHLFQRVTGNNFRQFIKFKKEFISLFKLQLGKSAKC